MYRAALHRRPIVNGYHSYAPLSYQVLKLALADRDHTVLDALASFGPLLIAADNDIEPKRAWASFLLDHPGITRMGDDNNWTLFQLPLREPSRDHCAKHPVATAAVFDEQGEVDAVTLTDWDPATRWITSHPQRVGDVLILDLERVERLCGLVMSMGTEAGFYPRTLRVATSLDSVTWETRFLSKMGGAAFLAALENPRDAQMFIPLRGKAARFITLRIEQSQPLYPWAVADIVVLAQR
jgi:hypothetical protein